MRPCCWGTLSPPPNCAPRAATMSVIPCRARTSSPNRPRCPAPARGVLDTRCRHWHRSCRRRSPTPGVASPQCARSPAAAHLSRCETAKFPPSVASLRASSTHLVPDGPTPSSSEPVAPDHRFFLRIATTHPRPGCPASSLRSPSRPSLSARGMFLRLQGRYLSRSIHFVERYVSCYTRKGPLVLASS